jgi:hypothetical protein
MLTVAPLRPNYETFIAVCDRAMRLLTDIAVALEKEALLCTNEGLIPQILEHNKLLSKVIDPDDPYNVVYVISVLKEVREWLVPTTTNPLQTHIKELGLSEMKTLKSTHKLKSAVGFGSTLRDPLATPPAPLALAAPSAPRYTAGDNANVTDLASTVTAQVLAALRATPAGDYGATSMVAGSRDGGPRHTPRQEQKKSLITPVTGTIMDTDAKCKAVGKHMVENESLKTKASNRYCISCVYLKRPPADAKTHKFSYCSFKQSAALRYIKEFPEAVNA